MRRQNEEMVREDQRATYWVWSEALDRWYVEIDSKSERASGLVTYADERGRPVSAFICRRGSAGVTKRVLGPFVGREWALKAIDREAAKPGLS